MVAAAVLLELGLMLAPAVTVLATRQVQLVLSALVTASVHREPTALIALYGKWQRFVKFGVA
jgi:hypothetical protein